MKHIKHCPLRVAALVCAVLCLAACAAAPEAASSTDATSDAPTLRFLLRGSASGLDRMLDALYAQMDDEHRWQLEFVFVDTAEYQRYLTRSLTAHESFDFVFDAPWLSLTAQAEQHSYKNLKSYFGSDAYPALRDAFPAEYLSANLVDGELYAIPFTNSYYDVPGIFYRKDLLKTLGLPFDTITTRDQMEQYWAAVQASGAIKPLTLSARGFYQLNLSEVSFNKNGIWYVPGWSFWDYPALVLLSADRKTVLDVVFPGDDDTRFADLPEPYNTNFLDDLFLQNVADARWLSADDLLAEDGSADFYLGTSASYEHTMGSGGSKQVEQKLRVRVPEGEVGFWAYDEAFLSANRTANAIPTNYTAWNYLCIPAYSDNTDTAMAFLDWLYSDWSRLDLFNYGVEGVDWQADGEDGYTLLEADGEAFSFPAYELAWSPQHHRIDSTLDAEERALMEYALDPGSYTSSPIAGFSLNTAPLSIEIGCLDALYAEYYTGLAHGAYGDDTAAKITELHTRSEAMGLEAVRAELIRQIQTYLNTQAAA